MRLKIETKTYNCPYKSVVDGLQHTSGASWNKTWSLVAVDERSTHFQLYHVATKPTYPIWPSVCSVVEKILTYIRYGH